MKRSQQSYAIPIALGCTALAVFLTTTMVSDGRERGDAARQTRLDIGGTLMEAISIEPTKRAIKALSVVTAGQGSVVYVLPVMPAPVPLPTQASAPDTNTFQLTTIVQSGAQRSAVISGQLVHVGDRLDKSTVVSAIDFVAVRITRNGEVLVLTMHPEVNDKPASEGATN